MKRTLPPWTQAAILTGVTHASRRSLERRGSPLPQVGRPNTLTSILRIPPGTLLVPMLDVDATEHHVYPPESIHITVANLDNRRVDIDIGLARLAKMSLSAPRFVFSHFGCSPDTLFVACIHDAALQRLRTAVTDAFEVAPARGGGRIAQLVTYANVVRFHGPGRWPGPLPLNTTSVLDHLELVHTDRVLSKTGTSIIANQQLAGAPD